MKKTKIFTPDETLDKFLKWFDFKKRLAFITAFVIGFITHISMITDYIMSQDGLWNSVQYFRPGDWEITLGRWGINLMQRLNNYIAIPNLTTISCILIMSVVAVIIVDLFDLKNKTSIIITSSILVVAPTFLVTVLYIYTSLSYCMCLLFSVLAIWSIYKIKNKKVAYILSVIFFVLSLSIYQSYIGLSIGLCLMISIINIIRDEKNIKEVLLEIVNVGIAIIIAGIMYLVITKIILWLLCLELASYRNADKFSIIDIIKNLKISLLKTYKDFLAFFLRDRIIFNTNYRREVFYLLLFISTFILTVTKIIKIDKRKRLINCATLFVLAILLPIALNVIDILFINTEMYALTAGQMIFIIPFCLSLIESVEKYNSLKWISIISLLFIIGTYYIADNTSYTALKMTYNQAYATTERLIDRIENTPDYDKSYPIIFGGIIGNNNFPRTSNIYQYTIGSVVNNTVFHGTYGGQVGTWVNYLKVYFGMDVIPAEANLYYTVVTSDEYKEMEIFPAQNSIKIRDGIIIVKLSDEPPVAF